MDIARTISDDNTRHDDDRRRGGKKNKKNMNHTTHARTMNYDTAVGLLPFVALTERSSVVGVASIDACIILYLVICLVLSVLPVSYLFFIFMLVSFGFFFCLLYSLSHHLQGRVHDSD